MTLGIARSCKLHICIPRCPPPIYLLVISVEISIAQNIFGLMKTSSTPASISILLEFFSIVAAGLRADHKTYVHVIKAIINATILISFPSFFRSP